MEAEAIEGESEKDEDSGEGDRAGEGAASVVWLFGRVELVFSVRWRLFSENPLIASRENLFEIVFVGS